VRIDSYQFGRIVIDHVTYNSDCIILADTVLANWRRKQGHVLSAEDLQPVVVAKPAILVVGRGASGLMKITKELPQFLQRHNIELEVHDTYRAVERFNELSQAGRIVAAALHLTC
jgi:hypothetical protein